MKNLHQYLRYYMGQSGPNDCGIACIAMILKYSGRSNSAEQLISSARSGIDGLSLLDLRKISEAEGLAARCVSMETSFLRTAILPCILHLDSIDFGKHFVVCFGSVKMRRSYKYIIADPATGISLINETDLERMWSASASLYFENIIRGHQSFFSHPWFDLMKISAFRKALMITVPFLNLCSTLLGIGISWMLQRGLSDSPADKKISLLASLMILLLLITFFKSLVAYIRQHVLIALNSGISRQLNTSFIQRIVDRKGDASFSSGSIRKSINEIQKIQNAVTAFISVLIADGSMLTFILTGLWFYEPVTALLNTIYFGSLFFFALFKAPENGVNNLRLQELSGTCENELAGEQFIHAGSDSNSDRIASHLINYEEFHSYARSLATGISKNVFWFEVAGTVNIILVFIYCLYKIQLQELSYSALMAEVILSYFITALVPKICGSLSVIAEGAILVRRYPES
jgi:ABC-type bacteriocin/lantibiotic exporter with double-glycine peptidase domain